MSNIVAIVGGAGKYYTKLRLVMLFYFNFSDSRSMHACTLYCNNYSVDHTFFGEYNNRLQFL